MDIRVENLAVARGGIPLIEGLSLDVSSGRALVLRGPNGSGKTTLLRTLAGLQPPLGGTITPQPDAIAYASHADGIKATLTVEENLHFWARIFGAGDIDVAVRQFDLTTLRYRLAGLLSAGQKRRLGLARLALTGRPVWLLDEPTVSLDADSVARFGEVVRTHLSTGGTTIIATHIDLGLEGTTLDLTAYKATTLSYADPFGGTFDDVFGDET